MSFDRLRMTIIFEAMQALLLFPVLRCFGHHSHADRRYAKAPTVIYSIARD